MGIGPGQHVVEAGTAGALTTAFAYAVGNEGHVMTMRLAGDASGGYLQFRAARIE